MTHILTLIPTQRTFRLTFRPSIPTQFFIETVCVPDLNLNNSLLSASHIPCKYLLNFTFLQTIYK